jgi:hypothetical protein
MPPAEYPVLEKKITTKNEVPRHHLSPVTSTTVTLISPCCKYKKGCISISAAVVADSAIEEGEKYK